MLRYVALLNVMTLSRPWPLIFVWKPDHKNLHHIPKWTTNLFLSTLQISQLNVHFLSRLLVDIDGFSILPYLKYREYHI